MGESRVLKELTPTTFKKSEMAGSARMLLKARLFTIFAALRQASLIMADLLRFGRDSAYTPGL
jgi:hypothetical protein